jgi:inner membrane protein
VSNGTEHRIAAASGLFCVAVADWRPGDYWLKHPFAAAALGAGCGTLPDLLEPPLHPNHRQVFHSVAFAALLGVGMYKTYCWEPETAGGQLVRSVLLITGAAYLVHLMMDATTEKSLPLLGRLP